MYLPSIQDRAADAENMRVQKETRDRDVQSQLDWDKLIELAMSGSNLGPIARTFAPQAAARVDTKPVSTASSIGGIK